MQLYVLRRRGTPHNWNVSTKPTLSLRAEKDRCPKRLPTSTCSICLICPTPLALVCGSRACLETPTPSRLSSIRQQTQTTSSSLSSLQLSQCELCFCPQLPISRFQVLDGCKHKGS